MKKIRYVIPAFLLSFIFIGSAISQKKISELTIAYNAATTSKQNSQSVNATHTIYIKGNMSRTETANPLFSASLIHDSKTGSAVVLREVSGQKLLIRMNPENWQDKNKRLEGIQFSNTSETKVIAGYQCIKAVAKTKDGFTITVYYTKDIIPDNKDYDPQFKNLNGLPLEYELTNGNLSINYTFSSINFNPVPASKFDIPKSGYREMTYDESKKLGGS
jgi:GLPGLI family protein